MIVEHVATDSKKLITAAKKGTVYWFTGLPGAGKTSIAGQFFQELKERYLNVVYLDGDEVRRALNIESGHYALNERLKLAKKYSGLCALLSSQEMHVVIATVSMFHEVRDWNRKNLHSYKEIYIEISKQKLFERDQKQLYTKALNDEIKDVVGIDLPFEIPKNPDIVIKNNGETSVSQIVENLLVRLDVS